MRHRNALRSNIQGIAVSACGLSAVLCSRGLQSVPVHSVSTAYEALHRPDAIALQKPAIRTPEVIPRCLSYTSHLFS
jgi:hypothetical protein